jgi:hypothetical protein
MTGHINVILILQSCTVLPGSSNETSPTSSDGTCDFSNIAVQQDVVVVEEGLIAVHEETSISIRQEQIPEDISFPDIKTKPHEVSCVCMSVIRHILPVSGNVSCFYYAYISGQLIQQHGWERKYVLFSV